MSTPIPDHSDVEVGDGGDGGDGNGSDNPYLVVVAVELFDMILLNLLSEILSEFDIE